jgi:4-carboxymuconolactone decarboxylase
MELSEKARSGVTVIREMLGEDAAQRLRDFAVSGRFGSALTMLALEFAYADNWDENGLSRRERSLLLIGALTALRQPDELENHVRLGLANGIGVDELEQILLLLVPYVGFPATSTASSAIRKALSNPVAGSDKT